MKFLNLIKMFLLTVMLSSNQVFASSLLELLTNRTPEEIQHYTEAVDQILSEFDSATVNKEGDYVIDLGMPSLVAGLFFRETSQERLRDLLRQMRRSSDFANDFKTIEEIEIAVKPPTEVRSTGQTSIMLGGQGDAIVIERPRDMSLTGHTVTIVENRYLSADGTPNRIFNTTSQRTSYTLEEIFRGDIPTKHRRIFAPIRSALIIEFQDAYMRRFLPTLDDGAKMESLFSFARDIDTLGDKPYFFTYYHGWRVNGVESRNLDPLIRQMDRIAERSGIASLEVPEMTRIIHRFEEAIDEEIRIRTIRHVRMARGVGLAMGGAGLVALLYHLMEEPVEASAVEEDPDSDHVTIYGVLTPEEMSTYQEHYQSIRNALSNSLEQRTRPPSDIGFGF